MPSACGNSAEDEDYCLEDNPVSLIGQIILHSFDGLSYLYSAFRASRYQRATSSVLYKLWHSRLTVKQSCASGSELSKARSAPSEAWTRLRPFFVLNLINNPKKAEIVLDYPKFM